VTIPPKKTGHRQLTDMNCIRLLLSFQLHFERVPFTFTTFPDGLRTSTSTSEPSGPCNHCQVIIVQNLHQKSRPQIRTISSWERFSGDNLAQSRPSTEWITSFDAISRLCIQNFETLNSINFIRGMGTCTFSAHPPGLILLTIQALLDFENL
jgi:hypothetical protein